MLGGLGPGGLSPAITCRWRSGQDFPRWIASGDRFTAANLNPALARPGQLLPVTVHFTCGSMTLVYVETMTRCRARAGRKNAVKVRRSNDLLRVYALRLVSLSAAGFVTLLVGANETPHSDRLLILLVYSGRFVSDFTERRGCYAAVQSPENKVGRQCKQVYRNANNRGAITCIQP